MFVTYLYINSRHEVVQQLPLLLNQNFSFDFCCHLPAEFLDPSASLHMDQVNMYNRRGCGLNQAIILRLKENVKKSQLSVIRAYHGTRVSRSWTYTDKYNLVFQVLILYC
jgi:hypothetical protein